MAFNIRDLSISGRTIQSQVIQQSGGMTVRLQDKDVTENGNVIADIGYDGLSRVGVNVSGGSGSLPTQWYLWKCTYRGTKTLQYLPFNVAPQTLSEDDNYTFGFNINAYMQGINEISSIVSNVANYQKGDTDTSFFVDAHLGHEYELVDGTPYYISDSEPIAYAWVNSNNGSVLYTNFDEAPTSEEIDLSKFIVDTYNAQDILTELKVISGSSWVGEGTYTRNSNTSFTVGDDSITATYTRHSSKDFTLWS